jgi:hypothetical protein
MLHRLSRARVPLVVLLLLFTRSPLAAAQAPGAEAPGASRPALQVPLNDRDAGETRQDFEAILKRLPPEVGRVMRLDGSLMRNEAYLAPYPVLASFLQQHPEVVQNPRYYLEHVSYELWNPNSGDTRSPAYRAFNDVMEALAVVFAFGLATAVLTWLIKTLIDYRRWHRTSKIQTEVHTKILDRFTSNEDLMAYMQTPAGRRFLESAPLPIEGPARSVGAPVSRILWSLQAGIVLAVAGLGLLYVSGRVDPDVAQAVFALGVLVLAVGSGFVVSAAASFLLSRRLGLLETPAASREHTGVPAI